MPKLFIRGDGIEEYVVDLKPGSNTVGRSSKCTVPLRDNNASRVHSDFVLTLDQCLVIDRGSMNGTLVNGRKVDQATLNPGDCIRIGSTSLYYEKVPEAASPAPEPEPGPTVVIRDRPEVPATSTKRTVAGSASGEIASLIPDYAVRTGLRLRALPLPGVWLIALTVTGMLIVGAALSMRGRGRSQESDDRLREAGLFETAAGPDSLRWSVEPGSDLEATLVSDTTHEGKGALAIRLSDSATGRGGDCMCTEELPLSGTSTILISGWARGDGVFGGIAWKIEWLDGGHGTGILEEQGPHTMLTQEWNRLEAKFVPPEGAKAARIGCRVFGRPGRVILDDVRVKQGTSQPVRKKIRNEGWNLHVSEQGGLSLWDGDEGVLFNTALVLQSSRDGETGQGIGECTLAQTGEGRLEGKGWMLHPKDFKQVTYEIAVAMDRSAVTVVYTLPGESREQIDVLCVDARVPVPEGSLPADATGVLQQRLSPGGSWALEYAQPVRIRTTSSRKGVRLRQEFPGGGTETLRIGFKLVRLNADREGKELLKQVRAAQEAGREGLALDRLRRGLPGVTELQAKMELQEIRTTLEGRERDEWEQIGILAARAELTGQTRLYDEAVERIEAYLSKWTVPELAEQAGRFRAGFETRWSAIRAAPAEDRARRLREQAERSRAAGWETIQRELEKIVRRSYSETRAAADVVSEE